ncbi:uncharacterized protein LOC130691398 [Daphnia carinata]|uniref:uncharacterized protein LOC130691398 n=1 Tax=Daphnia carinata TaxID=120202 RepID=UPI0025801EA9|nr:uncharacterized protein LOC130691398 [Daphnia carinata]
MLAIRNIKRFICLRTTEVDIRILKKRTVMQSVSDKTNKTPEDPNAPLSFSKSKAAKWSAKNSFSGRNISDDSPWYQPFAISASVAAILLWFCVFREENDIDKELGKTLYERVDGMERKQLELALKHSGPAVDTIAIRKRLDELDSNG